MQTHITACLVITCSMYSCIHALAAVRWGKTSPSALRVHARPTGAPPPHAAGNVAWPGLPDQQHTCAATPSQHVAVLQHPVCRTRVHGQQHKRVPGSHAVGWRHAPSPNQPSHRYAGCKAGVKHHELTPADPVITESQAAEGIIRVDVHACSRARNRWTPATGELPQVEERPARGQIKASMVHPAQADADTHTMRMDISTWQQATSGPGRATGEPVPELSALALHGLAGRACIIDHQLWSRSR